MQINAPALIPTALGLQMLRMFSELWAISKSELALGHSHLLTRSLSVLCTSLGAFLTCPLEGSGTPTQHSQMKKRRYNIHVCVLGFLTLYTDLILTSNFNKCIHIKIQEQGLYREHQCATESPRSEGMNKNISPPENLLLAYKRAR